MTRRNPDARPDAAAVLRQWNNIRGQLFVAKRRWRLRKRDEPVVVTLVLDIVWLLRLGIFLSKRFVNFVTQFALLFRRFF